MEIRETLWQQFFKDTRDRPPSPLLERAVGYVPAKENAIDLGAGALNDCRYLLGIGFAAVQALDIMKVEENAKHFPPNRFRYLQSSFEAFEFPVALYDLVNAQFSLPFTDPRQFPRVFSGVIKSLRPGGIFVGQLFGDRDEWFGDPEMTFHTAEDAKSLFSGSADLIFFDDEEDWMGKLASGDSKHWHRFHIIARRR